MTNATPECNVLVMMDGVLGTFQRAAGDHQRGASEIERTLVRELLLLCDQWSFDLVRECADQLVQAHPAMANLRSLALRAAADESRFVHYLETRNGLFDGLDDLFAEHCWPLIEGRSRLLTISRSSAVAAVLEGAWQRGWRGEVVVFDGSVAGGGREQAGLLAESGWNVQSQPDAAMVGRLDERPLETVVVVGADAFSERRVVNACGTGALLELAAARAVPAVVAADSAKELPDALLQKIVAAGRVFEEPQYARSWSVFEVFSADFVTWRVDEHGRRKLSRAARSTMW